MNYANVKRVGDHFSITNKNEAERLDIDLCSKCANKDNCGIFDRVRKESAIIAPIKRCKIFSPLIPFSILDGLDAPVFNTMRVRAAWAKRLRQGDTVFLYASLTDEVIGKRTVSSVISGNKHKLLTEHAHLNHTCLTKKSDDPVQYVENILMRSMGRNFYNSSDLLSVIYLTI